MSRSTSNRRSEHVVSRKYVFSSALVRSRQTVSYKRISKFGKVRVRCGSRSPPYCYLVLSSFSSVVLFALLSLPPHVLYLSGIRLLGDESRSIFAYVPNGQNIRFFSRVFRYSAEAGESIAITRRTRFVFDFNRKLSDKRVKNNGIVSIRVQCEMENGNVKGCVCARNRN